MNNFVLMSFFLFAVFHQVACHYRAFAKIAGSDVTLGNSFFNITFTAKATVRSLYKNDAKLVNNIPSTSKTWYLDWNGGKALFSPSRVEIASESEEMVHVYFIQEPINERIYIEFHQVVFANISGLYQYIKASNPTNMTAEFLEFRTVHHLNPQLMPKLSNIVRSDFSTSVNSLPTIQDATWQEPDGYYYSKYDFCGYIRETPWFGVFGENFGAWIVSASREYHSSGPLKQELLVHQDSLMLNYFHSSHFGTPALKANPGFSMFYGPYLVYLNSGESEEEILSDVARQALIEQAQWPYEWVDDDDYPLERGSVRGKVLGQTKAMVVVYDSDVSIDNRTEGYLYHVETDEDGGFEINNIRPGEYQIQAYPLAGHGSENLARENITVSAGLVEKRTLTLLEPSNILWSIGETNRRADTYRYSDEQRNYYWHLLPPANLTFQVGQSDISKQWYYAQTKSSGVWKITFNDQFDGQNRILRVAFAGVTTTKIPSDTDDSTVSIFVDFNGYETNNFIYENDKSIYRGALQSGSFHAEKIVIEAKNIVNGTNVVSFRLERGMVMYDAISWGVSQ